MRVMCILTVWNEREYLPLKLEYCKQNKLEPYIIDNMSTDGSWEYLQENKIPSHRLSNSFILLFIPHIIIKSPFF